LWAPNAQEVKLVLHRGNTTEEIPLACDEGEYFSTELSSIEEGTLYSYRLDGGELLPDPCSLHQPQGIDAPSAVFAADRFEWSDSEWKGVPRAGLSIYELHTGTFTVAGTLDAIVDRLLELRDLGITAIELMPVCQFPGQRNWGYDGVFLYAVQNSYGGPRALQRLVDAAHRVGIAVILDVVYNHFGPEGNHMRKFAPYFTDKYKTPWGDAVNYDDRGSDGVRAFVLNNVRMWLKDFHLDGLRLDAVHAIYDLGAKHLLREIREVADEVAEETGREIHIIAESDLNDPRVIHDPERGGYGLDAQWSDDFHHAVHAFLTQETIAYYVDYADISRLVDAMNRPFVFTGAYSRHRGRRHGAPPTGLSGDRFVVCTQNHDQIGNRAIGDRMSAILSRRDHGGARLRLAASLLLLSPYLPMLFMGEEYGETKPFPFFCDFESEELSAAVREGRRREFSAFVEGAADIPDPTAESTFRSANLSWRWTGESAKGLRRLHQQLLHARLRCLPLQDFQRHHARLVDDKSADPVLELVRGDATLDLPTLWVYFNLSNASASLPSECARRNVLFSSEAKSFGGERTSLNDEIARLLPFECLVLGDDAYRNAFCDPDGRGI
jgi:maltooligosyltrehalose trehalohydrolase